MSIKESTPFEAAVEVWLQSSAAAWYV